MLSALGTVTTIATVGQGIHDLTIIAFPIVFIVASLTLNRAFFRLCVGLALAAVGWLAFGEVNGWFVPQPFNEDPSNWFYFFVVVVILLVAAFAVDLLATNMRKNLEQAQREIAERKRTEATLHETEQHQKIILESIQAGILLIDAETHTIVSANPAAAKMIGLPCEQFLGFICHKHFCPAEVGHCPITDLGQNIDNSERVLLTANGGRLAILKTVVPVMIQGRRYLVESLIDITERKRAEEQLHYLGIHDVLTGIYNRAFFEAELERFETSREFPVSVIVADVDKLKVANDTHGHAVGDELLRRTASVLQSAFRAADVCARIGGDEFAVLLPHTDAVTAEHLLSRVRAKLVEHNTQHPDLPVQVSFGAATAQQSQLLEALALGNMYADKSARQSSVNHSPTPKGISDERD